MLPPSITDVFAESAYIYAKILPRNSGSVTLLKFRSPKKYTVTLFQILNMDTNTNRRREWEGQGQKCFENESKNLLYTIIYYSFIWHNKTFR